MSARLPPIGFWSYATLDDKASDGKLTELRLLLSRELQQQYGRDEVKIFQDVSAIPPGAQWEARIRTALFDSTFFIPLITPNFIQSEWCNREFFLFRERERALKTRFPALQDESLIFPIYYVRIDGVEAFSDELLDELHRLQRLDFTRLRLKDYGSEAREKVAQLAESICRLLRLRWEEALVTDQPEPVEFKLIEVGDLRVATEEVAARAATEKATQEAAARAAAEKATQEAAAGAATEKANQAAAARAAAEKANQEAAARAATENANQAAAAKAGRATPASGTSPGGRTATPVLVAAGSAVAVVLLFLAIFTVHPGAPLATASSASNTQEVPTANANDNAAASEDAPAQPDPAASLLGNWSVAGVGCSHPISIRKPANSQTPTVAFGGRTVNLRAVASPASGVLAFRDDDGARYELSGGKATVDFDGASQAEVMTRCGG